MSLSEKPLKASTSAAVIEKVFWFDKSEEDISELDPNISKGLLLIDPQTWILPLIRLVSLSTGTLTSSPVFVEFQILRIDVPPTAKTESVAKSKGGVRSKIT